MTTPIVEQLRALGLAVPEAELPKLVTLIGDLEKAAAVVRGPRPYSEEPLSGFRLPRT
jgi:hypothetical protein